MIWVGKHRQGEDRQAGFTIIELVVAIAVVGILAAITVMGYGAWQHQTRTARVKSDLGTAATAMNASRNFGTSFPASIPSSFTPSEDVSLTLYDHATSTYCIDGTSISDGSIDYYIDQNQTSAHIGTCAGR